MFKKPIDSATAIALNHIYVLLREWMPRIFHVLADIRDELRQRPVSTPVSALSADSPDALSSPPPAVLIVLNYYAANPEVKELSVRERAELIGVGKSTVSEANKWIQ